MPTDKLSKIANLIGIIVIPIVLAVVGNQYTETVKDKEVHGKLVELAINILDKEPSKNDNNIRKWATKVIDKYSGVPFGDSTQKDLIEKIPLNSALPSFYKDIILPKNSSGPLRIENNVLVGDSVHYQFSSNTDTAKMLNLDSLKVIVMHVLDGTVLGAEAWFQSKESYTSTHIIIGLNGSIVQVIPFNHMAFHAPTVQVTAKNKEKIKIFEISPGRFVNPNKMSIGISLEGNQFTKFTKNQIDACRQICLLLKKQYKINLILNHSDISPGKSCPGPNFPIEEIRKDVFGGNYP